jgi:hypothetical protein
LIAFVGVDHVKYPSPEQDGTFVAKVSGTVDALHHHIDCSVPMQAKNLVGCDLDVSVVHGAEANLKPIESATQSRAPALMVALKSQITTRYTQTRIETTFQ